MEERRIGFFNSRELELRGVLNTGASDQKRPWVVISHGMLSDKFSRKHTMLAETLQVRGFNVFRFDFSGQGESQGRPEMITFSDEVDDLQCAMDTCIRFGARSFVLCGSSMGSAVSAIVGAQRSDVAALALMATLPDSNLIWKGLSEKERVAWRENGYISHAGGRVNYAFVEDAKRFDVAHDLVSFAGPLLAIHGGCDELIPLRMVAETIEGRKAPTRLEVLEEADHRFSEDADRRRLVELICEFVEGVAAGK